MADVGIEPKTFALLARAELLGHTRSVNNIMATVSTVLIWCADLQFGPRNCHNIGSKLTTVYVHDHRDYLRLNSCTFGALCLKSVELW